MWLSRQKMSELPHNAIKHLRKQGVEYIKEIPFYDVWKAFWGIQKAHIFVEKSHKAAIVYAYNSETK